MNMRIKIILLALVTLQALPGCSKKKEGICYCKYFSGDKKEFDLRSLDRQTARDSCSVLSRNASAFAGSCKLKD